MQSRSEIRPPPVRIPRELSSLTKRQKQENQNDTTRDWAGQTHLVKSVRLALQAGGQSKQLLLLGSCFQNSIMQDCETKSRKWESDTRNGRQSRSHKVQADVARPFFTNEEQQLLSELLSAQATFTFSGWIPERQLRSRASSLPLS